MGFALSALAAAAIAAPAGMDAAVAALQQGYIAAWNQADPAKIAGWFAADGDFTNPTGFHAQGRTAIAGFYAQAFAAGYAGSRGGFTVAQARLVSPGVAVIDGEWSIKGAHTPQGAERPMEHGTATAVVVSTAQGWRVAALREQAAP